MHSDIWVFYKIRFFNPKTIPKKNLFTRKKSPLHPIPNFSIYHPAKKRMFGNNRKAYENKSR